MTPTIVGDSEQLYRAIRANSDAYAFREGNLHISVNAFNDPGRKPSVDRSGLCADPKKAKKSDTDGVTALVTQQVRAISSIRVAPTDKNNLSCYAVDAIHRPIVPSESVTANLAHCQIECSPDVTQTHFTKKVREALARIATANGFIVPPLEHA